MDSINNNESSLVLNIWKILFSFFFFFYPATFFTEFYFQNGSIYINGRWISDSFGIFIEGILNPILSLIGFISVFFLWFIKKTITIKLVKIVIGIFLLHLLLSSLYNISHYQSQAFSFILSAIVFITIFSFMFKFFTSSNKVKQLYNLSS